MYAEKSNMSVATSETTYIRYSPMPTDHIMQLSNSAAEPSVDSYGRTTKHLACVLRVKDGQAATLLVNLYDELGRITGTTNGDVSIDYEYDKDSRLIKESRYYKGFYQGQSIHDYVGNMHSRTTYSADGKIIYDGETYDEFFNNNGQLSGINVYIDEKHDYTSLVKDYDRKTGWIIDDYSASRSEVIKDLKHSYAVNERGHLVETVTDKLAGKIVSTTIYNGEERSEDKILQYEEYDSAGSIIRGYENKYSEINGINVLDSKAEIGINPVTGKIRADMYFYSTSEFNIEDDIYEFLGMEPSDFSSLTVHMVSSGYDDIAVSYSSSGTKMKTVTSKRDDSGRVINVIETDRNGAFASGLTFEYDESGNCRKMIVEDSDEMTEYIFGYIYVPNSYCEPFTCTRAEEYIGK